VVLPGSFTGAGWGSMLSSISFGEFKVQRIFNLLKIDRVDLEKPSVIVLILANLLPLYGIIFLDWEVFPLLFLYWVENIIVGVFQVFKMALSSPQNVGSWIAKVLMIPFFCFHYGMFTAVHGIFVIGLFGGYFSENPFPNINTLFSIISDHQIYWPILALFISHGLSFVYNYIGKGEYKNAILGELMGQPYGRVVVLHVTIIFGGFLIAALGSPAIALVLLIALKAFIDILAHLRQHNRYNQSSLTVKENKIRNADAT
jgi:hypothetical protein